MLKNTVASWEMLVTWIARKSVIKYVRAAIRSRHSYGHKKLISKSKEEPVITNGDENIAVKSFPVARQSLAPHQTSLFLLHPKQLIYLQLSLSELWHCTTSADFSNTHCNVIT